MTISRKPITLIIAAAAMAAALSSPASAGSYGSSNYGVTTQGYAQTYTPAPKAYPEYQSGHIQYDPAPKAYPEYAPVYEYAPKPQVYPEYKPRYAPAPVHTYKPAVPSYRY